MNDTMTNNRMEPQVSTGLFGWPSVAMQQMALAGSVLMGLIAVWQGLAWATACLPGQIHQGGVVIFLLGLSTVAMALYSGWKTRWLTRTTSEPLALVAGRIAMFFALIIGVLIVVAAIFGKNAAEACGN